MSVWSQINHVTAIRSRYFTTKGIRHHFDCSIYACNSHGQRGKFCDCGLLHDLRMLDWALASLLYEKFEDDLYLHQVGKKQPKMTKKRLAEQTECMKILESVFGKIEKPSAEELKEQYDDMHKVLYAVFPNYSDIHSRLELWFEKENNYDKNEGQSENDKVVSGT